MRSGRRYAETLFRRADRNGDGALTEAEFGTLRKLDPVLADADLAYFDDDQNKRIELREFVDKPNPIVVRYDRNSDCRVTADEVERKASGGKPSLPPGSQGMPGAFLPDKRN